MGKKHKKDIKKAFKGWDDITPEEQMQSADEFFNIEESYESNDDDVNLLDLGYSKKKLVDRESGLEKDIVSDIVKTFGTEGNDIDIDDEEIPESVQNVLNSMEDIIVNPEPVKEEEEVHFPLNQAPTDPEDLHVVEEQPVDPYEDIRKFGCIVRKDLGLANFSDGIAPFTFNYHSAMDANLAYKKDTSILSDAAIDTFKKALIVNRYPAALFTKEEFVASGILNKGEFVQNSILNAIFVNVLDIYIAVYFVRDMALTRFDATITDVIDKEAALNNEYGDPYYNIWLYLAAVADEEEYSFGSDKELVEIFYESCHNDKDLVLKFLKDKYINDTTNDEVKVSIINRDSLELKHATIMGEFVNDEMFDDLEDDEDDLDEVPDEDFGKVIVDETADDEEDDDEPSEDDMKNMLEQAIKNNASDNQTKKDDSMVVEVHHKEGNI